MEKLNQGQIEKKKKNLDFRKEKKKNHKFEQVISVGVFLAIDY